MGKNDFLSPKAISNRIKAKGLQKLRWYCQMCGKQCRDENGFKCHLSSDSHQRQMMVFGQNPERVVEGYTEEFEASFLELLRQSHPFSRVAAKVVYNDYIANKDHVHMNSTKFHTLTEFVKYLGRTGKCRVDETEKGWFISLIQEDPMEKLSTERRLKRDRAERDEEERQVRALEEQIERASKAQRTDGGAELDGGARDAAAAPPESHELVRAEDDAPLAFGLSAAPRVMADRPKLAPAQAFAEPDGRGGGGDRNGGAAPGAGGRAKSKLELLMEQEKAKKAAAQARQAAQAAAQPAAQNGGRDSWVRKGLIVKVMAKELKEQGLYKAKGVITRLPRAAVAEVSTFDPEAVVQVHQTQLETVLPKPGGSVMVLRGAHAGTRGTLLAIDEKKFQAQVRVLDDGRDEVWLEYEDVCKVEK